MNRTKCALIAFLFLCHVNVFAQSVDSTRSRSLSQSWSLGELVTGISKAADRASAPTVAVEVTPIENWLELEAGVTPLFTRHSTEWDTDLLFKKPWTLSKKAEFMFGIGPEWVHTTEYGVTTNSIAGEAVLDFMFWPSGKHRFGWYLEPGYEYNFGRGHEQSLGISGGLLIAIR